MKTVVLTLFVAIISFLYIFQHIDHIESPNAIEVGSKVPDFSLLDQDGHVFHLAALLGKRNLVIYFYPKDNTSGCTEEACSFRDLYQEFTDADAEVIGISSDDHKSHNEFASSHRLPFILLSDENKDVRKLFGVPTDFFGMIPGRVTYIVDKKGIVRYMFKSQTQVEKHVNESLRILRTFN